MDVYAALHDYAIWHETLKHSPETIAWYHNKLSLFFRWLAANNRAMSVTGITIADARAFIHAEGQRTVKCPNHITGVERPGKLSDRTLDTYVRAMRTFWGWLHTEGYISHNPMLRLQRPKMETRFKDVLSPDEVTKLLAACNLRTFTGSRMAALIAILFDCGLRAGEICALDVDDIDLTTYRIHVRHSKSKRHRFVPFSLNTAKLLRRYLTHRNQFIADPDIVPFFVGINRNRMHVGSLCQAIKRHGARAGVQRAHPHLFRHSAAVASLLNGASQFEVQRLLGHSQLSTTGIYMDLAQQHLETRHRQFSPMGKVDTSQQRPHPKLNRRKENRED